MAQTKRFTRAQLIAAHQQIEEERQSEVVLARKAAEWLKRTCGQETAADYAEFSSYKIPRPDAPYLPMFWLVIHHTQYEPLSSWAKSRMSSQSLPDGFKRPYRDQGFWIDLGPDDGFPAGTKYFCYERELDAHRFGY